MVAVTVKIVCSLYGLLQIAMISHKLERARRLLMRAVELVTGDEEERTRSSSVTNGPCCSSRETHGSGGSRRDNPETYGSQLSPPHRRLLPLTAGSSSASEFTHLRQRQPSTRGRESRPDHATSSKESQRLFGFNPPRTFAARKRRKPELSESSKKMSMWSRDCTCLNLHYQDWVPTVQEKISLLSICWARIKKAAV